MLKQKEREAIFKNFEEHLKFLQEHPDFNGAAYVPLGRYGNNRWAIAMSWFDYDGEGHYVICGKVAYQSINNIMQCDYDIDWDMPYDDVTGEVDDTEVEIEDDTDIEWLINQWERIEEGLED